jgi:hypothetical protein
MPVHVEASIKFLLYKIDKEAVGASLALRPPPTLRCSKPYIWIGSIWHVEKFSVKVY